MRRGLQFTSWLVVAVLCLGSFSAAVDAQTKHKPKKIAPPPPPLPSGPRGPVPQVPLDSMPAVAPQVTYKDGLLTIVAPNSSLGDILRAVRKLTSAEMDIPSNANERVVTHLGPGRARDVMADLLNGSKFNYVLLGSPSNSSLLTRVVLVAKTADVPNPSSQPQSPGANQMGNVVPPSPGDMGATPDSVDADSTEEPPPDENSVDQNAAETEQPPTPDQPGVKTPQQMLQEMQQRQLQMQQQQQYGQPGYPPPPGVPVPQNPQPQ
jgi:hypothetical protein